ncbi:hypothetical protein [Chryseobacterium sp. FH1]|uniref:hypothetical protein n=1 Tax=Chryseobacterium sp. FH1 TaxID=1233951 RepID=UPI0004E30557|nr:hypothetical protein [Chryseobacterium sp. FH1]KFC19474.1 hypothetical protein IO90_09270 [Chryseobacterium sp. FH1]
MEEKFKSFEKSIKKKHSFSFTPKYEEEFRTQVSEKVYKQIAIETFEKIDCELTYIDENIIQAKRKQYSLGFTHFSEGVSVDFKYGKVTVKSKSLGNEIWDNGQNSKRVKLFIYAFKEIEKSYDKSDLKEIEKEVEKLQNWDDYEIPQNLPIEKKYRRPNFPIVIIGSIILAIILGFLLAEASVNGKYIIGLFELLIALSITFSYKYLIKLSNFSHYDRIIYAIFGTIVLTYLLNQYFQYELILRKNNYDRIGFLSFIVQKLQTGLILEKVNTAWIGLIISWIFQIGWTFLICYLRIFQVVTTYKIGRIPTEVVDFAFYYFVKDKTEEEVRNELYKNGWTNKQNQDEVFEAIEGIQVGKDINKIN